METAPPIDRYILQVAGWNDLLIWIAVEKLIQTCKTHLPLPKTSNFFYRAAIYNVAKKRRFPRL